MMENLPFRRPHYLSLNSMHCVFPSLKFLSTSFLLLLKLYKIMEPAGQDSLTPHLRSGVSFLGL